MRLTLNRALTRHGFAVLTAGSASEARTLLEADVPDVLLSDLSMGGAPSGAGADGFSLITWARAAYPALPAVLMSGQAAPQDLADLTSDGMVCFLPKPFSTKALLDSIGRVVAMARSY